MEELEATEERTPAGLRTKQSESRTDHLHHWLRHHSLRGLGRGWALRLRLQRSVPGRGQGLAVWGQPEGLRSSAPWVRQWYLQAGQWNAMAGGPTGEARRHCWGG